MDACPDDIFQRLEQYSVAETFLAEKLPEWHEACRNVYINENSYQLAGKKRLGKGSVQSSVRPVDHTSFVLQLSL